MLFTQTQYHPRCQTRFGSTFKNTMPSSGWYGVCCGMKDHRSWMRCQPFHMTCSHIDGITTLAELEAQNKHLTKRYICTIDCLPQAELCESTPHSPELGIHVRAILFHSLLYDHLSIEYKSLIKKTGHSLAVAITYREGVNRLAPRLSSFKGTSLIF